MATKIEWKFKDDAPMQGSSDGFWYGLNEGYINPEEVLEDESQVAKIEEARATLAGFANALEAGNLLHEF